MKRGKKGRSGEVSYGFRHFRKKFFYKLFMVLLIALFFILLAYLLVFFIEKLAVHEKETGLKGGLGTLKWDFGKEEVVLDVLSYAPASGNQTIEVNISWSSGNKAINAIFVDFYMVEAHCNYTITQNLPGFGESKIYNISSFNEGCGFSDFANVTDVKAYAQVNVNLTQIKRIENLILYNDDNLNDILDLDDYFSCLVNVSYSAAEDPYNDYLLIKINETTHLVSFSRTAGWYGAQKFRLTAVSDDGDVLDVNSNGDDMVFYAIFIDGTRLIPNNLPEFLHDNCGDLSWESNASYVLDMKTCWVDDDANDSLTFRYDSPNESNLAISRTGNNLTLTPATNWNGTGYFYIYANDLKNETQGRVGFVVFRIINTTTSATTANQTNTTSNSIPKIKTASPGSESINISSSGSAEFSINAENYDIINWYVDGVLVKSDADSYRAEGLSEGEHEIRVEVKKGGNTDSKIWNLSVAGEEVPKKVSTVWYFIALVVILGIVILIVVFFIIKGVMEKKEENIPRPVIKELKPGTRTGYIPPSKPSGYYS